MGKGLVLYENHLKKVIKQKLNRNIDLFDDDSNYIDSKIIPIYKDLLINILGFFFIFPTRLPTRLSRGPRMTRLIRCRSTPPCGIKASRRPKPTSQ